MKRRNFLRSTSLTAAGFFTAKFPLVAGPFHREEFIHSHFPTDKKLDPAWVASLYERGKVTSYSKTKNELRYIGMPCGGICCGGVYAGGDGRLWLWDIFNKNQTGVVPKILPIKLESFNLKQIDNTQGTLYLEPLTQTAPLQQGFALSVICEGKTIVKRFHEEDWEDIIFEATYPVATIRYVDKNFPLEISLEVFSPFIPGDADDSGLPVTIQSFTLKNTSSAEVSATLYGWLENKILSNTEKQQAAFTRSNNHAETASFQGIELKIDTKETGLEKAPDYGTMMLASMESTALCIPDIALDTTEQATMFKKWIIPADRSPVAGIIATHHLSAGTEAISDFMISWHTPNISFNPKAGMTVQDADYTYYSARFQNAQDVTDYVATHFSSLKGRTLLWKKTWYDSTLPWWFMERTFANISTLATSTSHRFKSGRFYAWEGIGCCHGNCTHVYQYAQAVARIFPALERDTRERVDLGVGYEETSGMIRIRGEKTGPSIDGQAGTVLRIYREHQMNADNGFLQKNWSKIKQAVVFIMQQDKNKDGMEDTPMENTLDALWHGEIAWIVGLCIAGVRAGEAMAEEMNDHTFAALCRTYVENGRKNMEKYLFNGEYFIHRPDPAVGKKEIGSFNTCHIDQVYGQGWSWQVNLGRIIGKEKTMSALHALWKYNYMPDVGPYIKINDTGRFYAVAGEGGMIMNTNPKKDTDPYGNAKAWQIGYFSECMSGFEHQVASHMMAEGMVEESLILTRSIHDRYHAFKRNPFNEIECSDHYGRAMASYGTFISACGFTYHGPKGIMGFSPGLTPEQFTAPFTCAEGWGSYNQQQSPGAFAAQLTIQYGRLTLNQFHVDLHTDHKAKKVTITLDDKMISGKFAQTGTKCAVIFQSALPLTAGQSIHIQIA